MPNLTGQRICLIGGAGFIGHNLALEMRRQGADVSVIDGLQVNNLLAFTATAHEVVNREWYRGIIQERLQLLHDAGVPLYVQDARDYHQMGHLLNRIKPNVIVLLAAVAHAGRSNKDPYSTFDHSLRTLENALDWARGSDVDRFVYFSSSMVYGNFDGGVATEKTPCDPIGIYGALKLAGERLVIAYNQVFNLPYSIVRPSALYGERCVSRRVGQIFIENALQGLDVTIKGDGSDRLDFTYVGDLVQGVIAAATHPGGKNQIFNMTYGQSRSIAEMVEILRAEFPHVQVHAEPRDNLMPERGTLAVDKARELIGYVPQWPLERGFRKYVEWYKRAFDLRTAQPTPALATARQSYE